MGRTKELLENMQDDPRSFGSLEEFASNVGWNLSTTSSNTSRLEMHPDDFEGLMSNLSDIAISMYHGVLSENFLEIALETVLKDHGVVKKNGRKF